MLKIEFSLYFREVKIKKTYSIFQSNLEKLKKKKIQEKLEFLSKLNFRQNRHFFLLVPILLDSVGIFTKFVYYHFQCVIPFFYYFTIFKNIVFCQNT